MAASEKIRNGIITAWIRNEAAEIRDDDRGNEQDDGQADAVLQ